MSIPDQSQIDPYAVADMVAGFGPLYGRRLDLNSARRVAPCLLSSPALVNLKVSSTKWTT
jgi:hypothetical protein